MLLILRKPIPMSLAAGYLGPLLTTAQTPVPEVVFISRAPLEVPNIGRLLKSTIGAKLLRYHQDTYTGTVTMKCLTLLNLHVREITPHDYKHERDLILHVGNNNPCIYRHERCPYIHLLLTKEPHDLVRDLSGQTT